MSDRSSESSGEWIVLNEEEEELTLDNKEQSLSSELSYDAICHAVSDSIRSSFSSEELEWQYEQYENYIPPHRSSFIQEVDVQDFDTDECEDEDSNVEDDVVNKCVSTSDIEEEDNVDVVSISKIHSYKHNRNDRLNFILNFMLALVLASAVGLGIGHFLGWSHKCFKNPSVIHKVADNIVELPHTVITEQKKNKDLEHSKVDKNVPLFSENALDSVSCSSLKGEDSAANHDICNSFMNSNIAIESALTKIPMFMSSDVLELKNQDGISQNNLSDPDALNITPASDILTDIDWNLISNVEAAVKKADDINKVSSDNVDTDSLIEDEINNIELELLLRNIVKEEASDRKDIVYNSEIPYPVGENDNLSSKNKLNNNEFELLKEYLNEEKISDSGNNLTKQLKKDLNEVVQSLATIALARLSDVDEKYSTLVEESESVIKLFSDFQTLINTRITDIDNFVSSIEYKNAPKLNLKYLQKMVYTLVDSVDYLMKVSFKTLSKDGRKINAHKFSNTISKVIFNFNKKWEKNNRFWSESLEKLAVKYVREEYLAVKNVREGYLAVKNVREGYLKKRKENKYLKNKAQFDKHSKKNHKYKRYSMKS